MPSKCSSSPSAAAVLAAFSCRARGRAVSGLGGAEERGSSSMHRSMRTGAAGTQHWDAGLRLGHGTCICNCIACSRAADARPPCAAARPSCPTASARPGSRSCAGWAPAPRRSSDSARVASPGARSMRENSTLAPSPPPPPPPPPPVTDSARPGSPSSPARCPLPTRATELTRTSRRKASTATRSRPRLSNAIPALLLAPYTERCDLYAGVTGKVITNQQKIKNPAVHEPSPLSFRKRVRLPGSVGVRLGARCWRDGVHQREPLLLRAAAAAPAMQSPRHRCVPPRERSGAVQERMSLAGGALGRAARSARHGAPQGTQCCGSAAWSRPARWRRRRARALTRPRRARR